MILKQCRRCDEVKPLSEFHKRKRAVDNHAIWCKECVAIYGRWRRNVHPEKGRGATRHWRQNNPEKARCYTQDNPDKIREKNRRWRENNRDKRREVDRHHRARKLASPGNSFTEAEFIALCESYGNHCLCYGRDDVSLTRDHIIPLVKGGSDSIENIQALCQSCNSSKGAKSTDYR